MHLVRSPLRFDGERPLIRSGPPALGADTTRLNMTGKTADGLSDQHTNPTARASGERRSIEVEGLQHGHLPIPAGSRIGPLIATGGVRGVDPGTGLLPASVEEQAVNMFANLKRIIEAGGGRVEQILKLTIWIATPEGRAAVNAPWLEMFPDSDSRPARHILNYTLPGEMLVQCEALAVVLD